MDVSENRGIPKSSILIGFSTINHSFWGTPIFGNTHIQGCRFVPYTFSETPAATEGMDLNILVKPGFGGLIQGQIYKPVF